MSGTEHMTAATQPINAKGDGDPVNRTALLLIDPYNDFLSEGGKFSPPAVTGGRRRAHWSGDSE